jgi:hypothetical protein
VAYEARSAEPVSQRHYAGIDFLYSLGFENIIGARIALPIKEMKIWQEVLPASEISLNIE